jgi:hypothetical protein
MHRSIKYFFSEVWQCGILETKTSQWLVDLLLCWEEKRGFIGASSRE